MVRPLLVAFALAASPGAAQTCPLDREPLHALIGAARAGEGCARPAITDEEADAILASATELNDQAFECIDDPSAAEWFRGDPEVMDALRGLYLDSYHSTRDEAPRSGVCDEDPVPIMDRSVTEKFADYLALPEVALAKPAGLDSVDSVANELVLTGPAEVGGVLRIDIQGIVEFDIVIERRLRVPVIAGEGNGLLAAKIQAAAALDGVRIERSEEPSGAIRLVINL